MEMHNKNKTEKKPETMKKRSNERIHIFTDPDFCLHIVYDIYTDDLAVYDGSFVWKTSDFHFILHLKHLQVYVYHRFIAALYID